ncbi:MAG: hypothetical protein AAGI49_02300 [Bacteroidota bacterium]
MKRSQFTLLLLFSCLLLQAQKEKVPFQIGIQSGVNFTRGTLPESDRIKGDLFLGNSIGVLARSYWTRYKHRWGGLSNWVNVYFDYGIFYHYRGFNYLLGETSIHREQLRMTVPLMLSLRADNKYAWTKKWRQKKRYEIVRAGLEFDFNFQQTAEQNFETTRFFVNEYSELKPIIPYLVLGFGVQQYAKNSPAFGFVGISFHTGIGGQNLVGNINLTDIATNESEQISFNRLGSYFSIDCQYFIFSQKNERVSKQIIHNPRYL